MDKSRRSKLLLKIIFFFVIWTDVCLANPKLSDNMIHQKAVKDKILSGYDRTIRPTEEGSNTTEVETALLPRQIVEIDEEKNLFVMDSYLLLSWEDPRLTWNTTEYNGNLQLQTSLLWVPDISIHNSHSMLVDPTNQVLLFVMPSGTVIWDPPLTTKTFCPSIMEAAYPNDEVTCVIQIGSWTHDGWEIDFSHVEKVHMNRFLNNHPRWEVLTSQVRIDRNITFYDEYDQPYLRLDFYFPMKRRPLPEIEATRTPCILILLLALSIFWLPPNSSKKILLGGLLFLALIVMLVYVAWSTKYPLGVMFAVSFLRSAMYILVTTILIQIFIIFNLCNISSPVRPPSAIMQFLTGPIGKFACLRLQLSNDNIDQIQLKENSSSSGDSPTPKEDWVLFAAAVDRLFFVLMTIVTISVHHL